MQCTNSYLKGIVDKKKNGLFTHIFWWNNRNTATYNNIESGKSNFRNKHTKKSTIKSNSNKLHTIYSQLWQLCVLSHVTQNTQEKMQHQYVKIIFVPTFIHQEFSKLIKCVSKDMQNIA